MLKINSLRVTCLTNLVVVICWPLLADPILFIGWVPLLSPDQMKKEMTKQEQSEAWVLYDMLQLHAELGC